MLTRFFKVLTVPFVLVIWMILLVSSIVVGPIQYVIYGKGLDNYLDWLFNTSQRYEKWLGDK